MKIQIVTGPTIYESAKNLILGIDKRDLSTPYYIVVPDRFTLQAEKMLFEELEIKSTFNTNVVGLSSLATKVLGEDVKRLNTLDGIVLIKKILLEKREELKYFKKQSSLLCEEIYKTISQMKSSNIFPDKISDNVKSQKLANKIRDIKLIYARYEELKKDLVDDDDFLTLFAGEIQKKGLFEGSVFAFVGFDSFTATNFSIIKALSNSVKEIRFAVSKAGLSSNAYIYEKDISNKLMLLAKNLDVDVEVISPKSTLKGGREVLVSNLFGGSPDKKGEKDFLYVVSNNSTREEILFVAKSIKKSVFDGAKFNDFAVVCSDIEKYKTDIKTIFESFGISFYLDISEKLSETYLSRFIKACLEFELKGFLKDDILYFLSSKLIEVKERENLIAFVVEKNISGKEKFEKHIRGSNEFFKLFDLKPMDSYSKYASKVKEIINFVEEKHNEFVKYELDNGFVQKSVFEGQALEKIKEVCASLQNSNEELDLKDFVSIMFTALDSMEISSLPSFCDQVFVGDSSKSYFSKVKNLFVLGANAGELPVQNGDDGLFSDNEINSCCFCGILEPTIKMVNKRNRFKLFSILSQAEKSIVVSYVNFDEDGQKQERAFVVNNLMEIFNLSEKEIINSNSIEISDENRLMFQIGNQTYAKESLAKLVSEKNKFVGSLKSVIDFDEEKVKLKRDLISKESAQNLLLKNGRVKVTQLEKYYDCPFKHFVSNGLKPTQKIFAEVKPNDYGTIMHGILEDFVKTYALQMEKVDDIAIKRFLKSKLSDFLDKEVLEFLPNKEIFEKEIFINAFKLCKRAVYECQNSKFIPTYFEKKFDGKNLKIESTDVVGVVDRVDVCGDDFRVIDYKTGKITSAILSSLYYGQKLQLFLYGNSLKKELGKEFVGAFYFDAKVSYSKNEKTILKGVFKPSEKVIFALDKRLEKENSSDIVNVEKTKTGFSKTVLNQPNISELEQYAIEIASKAILQIKEGNILPSPTSESCLFCEFRSLCLYNDDQGYRSQKSQSSYFNKKETKE